METTERIVEAYVRYIKNWATIPNIRCAGQHEIDLFAIDPDTLQRYHIESGVSISGSFSKLTAKPFDPEELKVRVKQPSQRRTFGFFLERKFGHPSVVETLKRYGCREGNYTRVIVSWGWEKEVEAQAAKHKIELWDFRELVRKIVNECRGGRTYFMDDTLRTLHLFALAAKDGK